MLVSLVFEVEGLPGRLLSLTDILHSLNLSKYTDRITASSPIAYYKSPTVSLEFDSGLK